MTMSVPVPFPGFEGVLRLLSLPDVLLLRSLNSDCYNAVSALLYAHIRLLPVNAPVWTGSLLHLPVSDRIWPLLAKNALHIRSVDAKSVSENPCLVDVIQKCRLDTLTVPFRILRPVFVRSLATSNLHHSTATISTLVVDVPFCKKDLFAYKLGLTHLEWDISNYDQLTLLLVASRASLRSLSVVLRDSPAASDVIDEISRLPELTELKLTFQELDFPPDIHYNAKHDELFRFYKLAKSMAGLERLQELSVVLNASKGAENVQFNNARIMLVIGLFNKVDYSRASNRFNVALNVPQIGHNENLAFLRELPIKLDINGGNESPNIGPKEDALDLEEAKHLALLSKEYSYLGTDVW